MKTITLKVPVKLTEQSAPVEALHFREKLCAGDLRGIKIKDVISDDVQFSALTTIAGRMCGQTDALMEKLELDDYGEVTAYVLSFFHPAPSEKTSTAPSH